MLLENSGQCPGRHVLVACMAGPFLCGPTHLFPILPQCPQLHTPFSYASIPTPTPSTTSWTVG